MYYLILIYNDKTKGNLKLFDSICEQLWQYDHHINKNEIIIIYCSNNSQFQENLPIL